MKLTKKIKDQIASIPNIPVTNDKEPIPFSEFVRAKEEQESVLVDVEKLRGLLNRGK